MVTKSRGSKLLCKTNLIKELPNFRILPRARTVPPQRTMGNRIICRRRTIPGKLWSTPTKHTSGRNMLTKVTEITGEALRSIQEKWELSRDE